ncbi:hypothetical protein J5N97_011827 [Dioscorea zingiberensis]|uniref:S-locus glycoprotein domain-containing protein n=1 Tax=Dioscorea zingiberensis TaxID=325984 RepID=A0A9D5D347_9LILI|nr:hypothetical protein J5N97_011827 [Dioscorea zingiberensis]
MPGAPLGVNKQTGEFQTITSWRSSDDPSPGLFSVSLAPDKSSQIVLLYNGSQIYVKTGVWNGQFFSLLPEIFMEKNFYNFSFVDNEHQKYATYILLDPSQITYTLMDPSGQVKQLSWISDKQQWLLNYNQPPALCDVYSACGPFGLCDQKSSRSCNCYPGFEPASKKDWDLGTWSSGCSRKNSFQCNNKNRSSSTGDGFFEMKMTYLGFV